MNIAITHDWMTNFAGAEKVALALSEEFKQAPIYTSVYKPEGVPQFKDFDIRTSYLQKYPFLKSSRSLLLPFTSMAFENFDLSGYEVVISNTTFCGKGIIVPPLTLHLCYCHTPTRYLWMPEVDERLESGNFLKRKIIQNLLHRLRLWDYVAAQRPDLYIANSHNVRQRIKKFYHREALVIYPPVEVKRFKIAPSDEIEDYFLFVSRLVSYKKADLVVRAFNRLGLPLKVVGEGPQKSHLAKIAKENVSVLGYVDDKKLNYLLSHCRAFVFPAEEDFGIAPVEAMASGRPIIAYGKGGALETVVGGKTGIFFNKQTIGSLVKAVKKLDDFEKQFSPQTARKQALKFSTLRFKREWRELVNKSLLEYRKSGRIIIENIQ